MTPDEIASASIKHRIPVCKICQKTIPVAEPELIEDGYSQAVLQLLEHPETVTPGEIFFMLTCATVTWVSQYTVGRSELRKQILGIRVPRQTLDWKLLDPRFYNHCTDIQKRVIDYKQGIISKRQACGNRKRNKDYLGATAYYTFIKYKRWYKVIQLFTEERIKVVENPLFKEILSLYREGHNPQAIGKILNLKNTYVSAVLFRHIHRWKKGN